MPIAVDLAGRVAVVTGAARGLGASIAERLATAGAVVVMTDVDAAALDAAASVVRDGGGTAHAVTLDVTDLAAIDDTLAAIGARYGAVSILVNNAGVLRNAPLSLVTVSDWSDVIDTHLRGTLWCTKASLPDLIETSGAVVNVASGAVRGSDRGHSGYAAAKAGVVGLTRTLAVELGVHGVRVNAVAPGVIESDMTRSTAEQLGIEWPAYLADVERRVPLRRIGQPVDVANAVCFLASELSSYITGETLFIAGGPVGGI